MSKLLIWFHTLPDDVLLDAEGSLLDAEGSLLDAEGSNAVQNTLMSVYQQDDTEKSISRVFKGSLKDFLDNKSDYVSTERIIVWLPAKTVLYHQLTVPSRSRSRIRQALPFLLEDYLLEDSEQYFFALGNIKNGQCNVAIIRRNLLNFLWQQFARYRLPVSVLTSEAFMFSEQFIEQEGQWSIRSQADELIVCDNKELAFNANFNNAEIFLNSLFIKYFSEPQDSDLNVDTEGNSAYLQTAQKLIVLETDNDKTLMEQVCDQAEQNHIPYEIKTAQFQAERGLNYWPVKNTGINLLQDEFQLNKLKQSKLPYLKVLLFLFVIGVFSQVLFMTYQWYYYEHELTRLEQQVEDEFFGLFPDAKRLIDVRVQTLNRLNSLTSGQSQQKTFLSLLLQAGYLLKKLNGIELVNLRYNDNQLTIEVRSREFIFKRLKQQLSGNAQLRVTEQSSSKDEKGIHTVLNFQYID